MIEHFNGLMLPRSVIAPDVGLFIDNDAFIYERPIDGARAVIWWAEDGTHIAVAPMMMDVRRRGQIIDRSERFPTKRCDIRPELYGACLDIVLTSTIMTGKELWYYLDVRNQGPDSHIYAVATDIIEHDYCACSLLSFEQRRALLNDIMPLLPSWITMSTVVRGKMLKLTAAMQDLCNGTFKLASSTYIKNTNHKSWYNVRKRQRNIVYIYDKDLSFGHMYQVACESNKYVSLYENLYDAGWYIMSYTDDRTMLQCIRPLGQCRFLSSTVNEQYRIAPGYAIIDSNNYGDAVMLSCCDGEPTSIPYNDVIQMI